jgi:hypothetical protein
MSHNAIKLLMIDNYDSFTYNIVQYFGELGAQVEVFRNDEISIEEIAARRTRRVFRWQRSAISWASCRFWGCALGIKALARPWAATLCGPAR